MNTDYQMDLMEKGLEKFTIVVEKIPKDTIINHSYIPVILLRNVFRVLRSAIRHS